MASPFLFIGLGNPGAKYQRTPHNLGFDIIERLAESLGSANRHEKFDSIYFECKLEGRKVFCIQPQTFMNLSGNAARQFVTFYKCDPEKDLVVVMDDLDLPPGKLRLRMGGGPGGHNGMKSMIEQLGTEQFMRLRLGVGRHAQMASDKYLLSKIPAADWPTFEGVFNKAVDTLKLIPTAGIQKAMDFCNQKDAEEKKS